MEQGAFMDVIRMFFAFIDGIVYNLIGDAHNLVIDIAHYKVFENVNELTNKVYAALGIFMLFKVSFSFINYLINPDSFTDKEKGVQRVITNIIIMFIMLISCPWAFETLWQLQADILDEAVIENFVFGDEDRSLKEYKMMDSCSRYSVAASNGDYIALMVLKGFYKPYTSAEIGYDLSNDDDYDSDYSEVKDKLCSYVINGTPTMYLVADVYNADADVDGASFPIIGGDLDIYIMDYKIIMSTAVGVVVLLILVGFAMDVGLRVVKLSFLELFAPIPIVSYIDPASGKNGMFKKWLKEVGATWASIFIRLLALYFSVRVIQEVGSLHHVSGSGQEASVWVVIFVIIGALMFAKQLPKLIQNITGVNLDGGFSLNPMKKLRDNALGGKLAAGAVTGTAAGGIALAGGAASNWWAAHNKNQQVKKDLANRGIDKNHADYKKEFKIAGGKGFASYSASVLAGGTSSAARAIAKGKDGTWHPIKNASAGIKESSAARNLHQQGHKPQDAIKDYVADVAGVKFSTGTTNTMKNELNEMEQNLANSKRNEQAMSNALNQRITEMGNLSSDLLKIFDGEVEARDSKRNITKYKVKTYEQYAEIAAKREAEIQGENWEQLDTTRRSAYISQVEAQGSVVDRATFEALNSLYNTRNEEDINGRKLERDINSKKSDIEKLTNRKKG